MFRFPALSAVAACIALPAAVAAAGPLHLASQVLVEARSRAPDGTTRVALVPARRVVPGDRVTFVLSWRNTGAQPLANVAFDNPVPAGLAYRAPATGTPAPAVSVDGRTFGALSALRVGSRPATADDVTHVRWTLDRPIPAGGAGRLAFQAVLR